MSIGLDVESMGFVVCSGCSFFRFLQYGSLHLEPTRLSLGDAVNSMVLAC